MVGLFPPRVTKRGTIELIQQGMPNASLSAMHVARLIAAASGGTDWRGVENHAIAAESIPVSYVITEERMRKAHQLPEVKGRFATPEANFWR
jgi:hypothetical protein